MIFNCYVSQQQYSWDCDVWHDRHLDLKIRVLTLTDAWDPLSDGLLALDAKWAGPTLFLSAAQLVFPREPTSLNSKFQSR